jgi:hypothetical protein
MSLPFVCNSAVGDGILVIESLTDDDFKLPKK